MTGAQPPLDPRPPVTQPGFTTTRRGYDPQQVERFVAEVSRRLSELVAYAEGAEQRVLVAEQRAAEAERRAVAAEHGLRAAESRASAAASTGISDALDEALCSVLAEAGKATDAVLAEARARAVALVQVAQRESDRVKADATLEGELVVARRRQEVDAALADRLAEQERLAAELDVLRSARRVAAGSARSLLDQLAAVATALDEATTPADGVVIDLTDTSRPDDLRARPSAAPDLAGADAQQLGS